MVVVAAPSYITTHGAPENVLDLQHHIAVLTHKNLDHWSINNETVRVSWRITTGNVAVTRDAVRAGLGITRLPAFFVAEDLADGKLVQLLPQHQLPKTVVTAV